MITASDARQMVREYDLKSEESKKSDIFYSCIKTIEEDIEKAALNGRKYIRYKNNDLNNSLYDQQIIEKFIEYFSKNGFRISEDLPYEDGEEYSLIISWEY